VGQVQDDSFEMGNVGVEVVAQAEEGDPPEVESEVAFDNFVLREA
jgi:hypothetical protein